MESNEQTELMSNRETDSYIKSRMTAKGRGKGVEGPSKKEEGLLDMDSNVVIVAGREV